MKIQKIFTLDQELVERLTEEKNQSAIVNDLLKEYYSIDGTEEDSIKISLKTADEDIKKAKRTKKTLEKRAKTLHSQREEMTKRYKNIPKEILKDFKIYPKMDVETLKVRFDGIYHLKHKELKWVELLKAWRTWHGIGT